MIDRWLANDWVLRVLSLLLAIGIWAQVTSQIPVVPRTVSGVPVTVVNAGTTLRAQVSPANVSVQIRGPSTIVNSLKPGAIRVYASVPYARQGTYTVVLHAESQAGGTQVVVVTPDRAKVTLSKASSSP
jgi:YbbR domain-containing protein